MLFAHTASLKCSEAEVSGEDQSTSLIFVFMEAFAAVGDCSCSAIPWPQGVGS